jgi:Trk K+ transport system NAD-binding subunit
MMVDTNAIPPENQTVNRRATRFERLRARHRTTFRRWLIAHLYDIRSLLNEARVPLIGFCIVMASGTLYWTHVYAGGQMTTGAALYETMTMLALEQDTNFPQDPLGRLLFFAIPIFGLGFIFQGVLDFGRLLLDKSARIEDWQTSLARTYSGHVIICGLGSVSYRVAMELLESGSEVVVIEEDWHSEFVRYALQLKIPVVHGNALEEEVLEHAGIWRAHSLIAATSDDMLNIKLALAAQRTRPNMHVVLRVFNEQLDYSLERSQFGPNTVFSSSALAASTLAAAAVCRGIEYALPLHDVLLGLTELTVLRGGYLDSRVDIIEQRFNVQVVAYKPESQRGKNSSSDNGAGWQRQVQPDTRLYSGDRVVLLGTLYSIGATWEHGQMCDEIRASLGSDIQYHLTPQYNRVIVCGLGTVGYRVVAELHAMQPRPEIVVVCDEAPRDALSEEVEALGITIIKGDARTKEVLHTAGIDEAYSVVAVTSSKLTNVQICLAARQVRSDIDMVLRVFSDDLAGQLEAVFGIQTTYSSSVLAASTLAAAAVVRGTGYAIDIGECLMATANVTVRDGDDFAGQTVHAIREQHGIIVATVQRDERRFLLPQDPDDSTRLWTQPLQAGDEITVLADIHTVGRVRTNRVTYAPTTPQPRQLAYPSTNIPTATWPGKSLHSSQIATPETAAPPPAPPHAVPTQHWLEQLQRVDAPEDVETSDDPAPISSQPPDPALVETTHV